MAGGGGVVDRTETVLQYLATRSESCLALIKFDIGFFPKMLHTETCLYFFMLNGTRLRGCGGGINEILLNAHKLTVATQNSNLRITKNILYFLSFEKRIRVGPLFTPTTNINFIEIIFISSGVK